MTMAAHDDGISSVKWSQSGNKIVTGSLDATVKIWSHSPPFPSPLPPLSLIRLTLLLSFIR